LVYKNVGKWTVVRVHVRVVSSRLAGMFVKSASGQSALESDMLYGKPAESLSSSKYERQIKFIMFSLDGVTTMAKYICY